MTSSRRGRTSARSWQSLATTPECTENWDTCPLQSRCLPVGPVFCTRGVPAETARKLRRFSEALAGWPRFGFKLQGADSPIPGPDLGPDLAGPRFPVCRGREPGPRPSSRLRPGPGLWSRFCGAQGVHLSTLGGAAWGWSWLPLLCCFPRCQSLMRRPTSRSATTTRRKAATFPSR
jgi:hypothetical protein